MTTTNSEPEGKRIPCGFCGKPIHVKDWGGVQKEKGFFHASCLKENSSSISSALWSDIGI